jgi:hypothetical protein
MTAFNQIADRYLASWNETDVARRKTALAEVFAADATYVDPALNGEGLAGIDAMIASVHQRFPGFRFTRIGEADGHNDRVRFSWALANGDSAPVVKGTDVATVANDRLASVVGFFDYVAKS